MNPRLLTGERIPCISLNVIQNLTPLSNATMEVFKQDALPIRTYVWIDTPNGVSEVYRTRQPQVNHGSDTATIQLDHAISEVGDYLIQDAIEEEMTVREAFVTIFTNHYRGSRWQLGTFTATETVTLDCDYDNVLETMLSILEQVPHYYLVYDFSTTPWTVSLASKTDIVTAEGRMSRNIASAIVKQDDKDLCTRVYVNGLPKPTGRENDDDAIGYVDADTIGTYGVVEKQTGSGDLTQEQAYAIAYEYLNAHKYPRFSIEISGEDLSQITGETLDSFVCGKRFRLAIPEDNITIEDFITKVSFNDALNSAEVSVTIGDELDPVINFLQDQSSSKKSSSRYSKKQNKINEGLGHLIEETDEHWQSMYWDGYNGLTSRITQTAAYWQAEFSDMYNGLHSFVEITAQHFQTEFNDMYNGFNSRFEATASYWRNEIENVYSGLSSRVEQTERSWSATVQAIGSNGQINAGTIAVAINHAGESEAHIDANKVYIGNETSTSVIRGKCKLSDVSADYINGQLATVANVSVKRLSLTNNGYIVLPHGDGNLSLTGATMVNVLKGAKIEAISGTNNYGLFLKTLGDDEWTRVSTFSRAVSSWTWGGGSGKINVTALPQNQTKSVNVSIDGRSSITSNGTYTYTVDYENGDGDDVSTGATKSVSVTVKPTKSQISLTRGAVSQSEPTADATLLKISADGWFVLTVTVGDVTKTYKLQVTA